MDKVSLKHIYDKLSIIHKQATFDFWQPRCEAMAPE